MRTEVVQLNLRIEKLRRIRKAFDVPSGPAEERAAADIMQVSAVWEVIKDKSS
jgi:hypothetical protein